MCVCFVSLVGSCRILRVLFETSNTHKQHKFCNLCARGYCFHFPWDARSDSRLDRVQSCPRYLPLPRCRFAETKSSLCVRLQTPFHCCCLPISLTLCISTCFPLLLSSSTLSVSLSLSVPVINFHLAHLAHLTLTLHSLSTPPMTPCALITLSLAPP